MPNKTFLVRLRARATTVEVHGEQLAFLTQKGKLAALFLLDAAESWSDMKPAIKLGRQRGRPLGTAAS